jgi:SAM-dependent methyltransferase
MTSTAATRGGYATLGDEVRADGATGSPVAPIPLAAMVDRAVGRRGLSSTLLAFVDESPLERESVLSAVRRFADGLPPEARVLDIGAGDAPYRELFDRCEYVTVDWANSPHEDANDVDITTSIDNLPIDDCTFDAVLSTQVLEHVLAPVDVLREAHRVLREGGALLITAPFVWEEHERPFDFQRFSSAGVSHALQSAGFVDIDVRARTDYFTTLAQLMRNARWAMGRAPDGLDSKREDVAELLDGLADRLTDLAPLDVERIFPLGWEATAWRR